MSEAIIARGGRKGGEYSSGSRVVTEVYTTNTLWIVPSNAVNNTFSVRIFGGGGAGFAYSYNSSSSSNIVHIGCGGGGGWMNNGDLVLTPRSLINIIIGKGGLYTGTNEVFWAVNSDNSINLVKAESGGSTFFGSYLSANGGSAGNFTHGGSGGAGGGGDSGGTGYQFGGGGGGIRSGGNGGPWGGGGGGSNYGIGGIYGGNGGKHDPIAENGTNTVGWTNVSIELDGSYITGEGSGGIWYGGGGGFGGNGGSGQAALFNGGGGGGYGADGGNGLHTGFPSYPILSFGQGGGGGYGKGGYGGTHHGGGGSYGRGGSLYEHAMFGGGGCGKPVGNCQNGADGICIIQYYTT